MNSILHRIFIFGMVTVVLLSLVLLYLNGSSYYKEPIDQRFFHEDYLSLKPSGTIGHGLGIVGTLLILSGITLYMIRKRVALFRKWGLLQHWLEFHIFLCTLGPILVLYHTSFKFGGVVSISFWSMVAVFLSGVIGRFIYLQIPRTMEGRALDLSEVLDVRKDLEASVMEKGGFSREEMDSLLGSFRRSATVSVSGSGASSTGWLATRRKLTEIRKLLKVKNVGRKDAADVMRSVRKELALNSRIARLDRMKRLFAYWHVAHLPFAMVMIVIMIIHVIITMTLGYKWIF